MHDVVRLILIAPFLPARGAAHLVELQLSVRSEDVGEVTRQCYERTVEAIIQWADFAAHVRAADGKLVSPEAGGGGSSSPRG